MTSWIELMGRHAAASRLYLTGHLQAYDPAEEQEFDFWSGPGDRCRIERSGDLVYVRNHEGAAPRNAAGSMQHIPGQFHTVHLGTFSPNQILGLQSLLFAGLSVKMAPATTPEETEFDGRKAWTTALTQPDSAASLETIIDDETGVLVGLRPGTGPWLIQVSRLAVHSQLDDELFDWRSFADTTLEQAVDNSPEAIRAARIAIMEAVAAALERRSEILEVIDESVDAESARANVARLLGISETAATAVLDMQLRRFAIKQRAHIRDELEQLINGLQDSRSVNN